MFASWCTAREAGSSAGRGRSRGVPEDGGAHRDLRAEVHEVDEDAQLTARFPPPSVLALERALTGPNLWVRGRTERARTRGAGDRGEVPEDGGAHRDLRAEVHEVDEDAQLTARV